MSLLEQFGVSLQNKGRKKSGAAPVPPFTPMPTPPMLSGIGAPGVSQSGEVLPSFLMGLGYPNPQEPGGEFVPGGPYVQPSFTNPTSPSPAGLQMPSQEEIEQYDAQVLKDRALTGNYRQQPATPNLLSMPVRDVKGDGAAQAKAAGIAGLLGTILGGPTGGLAAAQGVVSGMAPAQDYKYQAEANRIGLQNQEALQRNALERQAVGDYNQNEAARVGDARYLREMGLKEQTQEYRQELGLLQNELKNAQLRETSFRNMAGYKEATLKLASQMVDIDGNILPGAYDLVDNFNQAALKNGHTDLMFPHGFQVDPVASAVARQRQSEAAAKNADTRAEENPSKIAEREGRTTYLKDVKTPDTQAATKLKGVMAEEAPKRTQIGHQNAFNAGRRTDVAENREGRLLQKDAKGTPVSPANIDHILRQLRDAPQSRAALIKKIDPYADLRGANGVIPFSTDLVRKLYRDKRFEGKGIATEAQFKAEIDRINGEWPRTKKQLDQQLDGEDQRLADLAAKVGKVRDKETGAFVPSPLFDGTTKITTPPKIGAYGNITPNYNGNVGKKALGWKVTSYAEQNDTKDKNSEFGRGAFSPGNDSMEAGRSIAVTPGVKKYIDDLYGKDMKGQIVVVVIEKDGKRYKVNAKLDDVTSRNPALGDRIDIYNPKGVDPGDFPLADGKVITVLKGGIPADIAKGQAAQSLGLRPVSSGVKSTPKAVATPKAAPTPQPKPVQKPSRKPVSKMTAAEQDAEIARLQKRTGAYTIPGLSDSDTSMLFKPKKK